MSLTLAENRLNNSPAVFMGGTFDPIHNGHLRTALEIRQLLGADHLSMIPCHMPVHRDQPGCSALQRLKMVKLAVENEPRLRVDDREILNDEPSYTIETLKALRLEQGPNTPIIMVLGVDSFLSLPQWHQWQRLLDYGHILVVERPGWELTLGPVLTPWVKKNQASLSELLSTRSGKVSFHQLTPLGISATQIRDLIKSKQSPRYLLPEQVWSYIQKEKLYGYGQ